MAEVKPQSPLWWLYKLGAQLENRQSQMQLMDAYYTGDHPLPFLTKTHTAKIRNEFRQLLEDSKSNFMGLVVDTCEERLKVEGFRLSAANDKVADQKSWDIWQANGMDQESQTAFLETLVKGVTYLSVWEGEKYPTIAVEDASQTIVGYEPGSNYKRRAAALKMWVDDWTGKRRANVYLRDGIYKFEAPVSDSEKPSLMSTVRNALTDDRPRWKELENEFVQNRFDVVPIIALRNRPRLLSEGTSELADVYHVQNGINGFIFLLALAGYFGAHRQRWAAGIALMEDANGKPMEPFDSAVDRLWMSENPEAKFGEFSQTALDGYIAAIEQKVSHIAITTRTPRHYLVQSGQSPSGDAIKSAESGLIRKVGRKQGPFGEGLEETLRVARRFAGEKDAPVDSEIVWADPQTRSEAEITDAVIKQYDGGLIPWEAALEKLGYTQTQIARFSAMRASDALMKEMLAPTPPPAPVPPAAAA